MVYLISRIQTSQKFVRLADLDKLAPARGFHRCDGFGVGIERLERQGLLRRDAHQQQAKGVGHGEPNFLQRRSGFPLGAFIDAGANDGIFSHGVNLFLSYIVAQPPGNVLATSLWSLENFVPSAPKR
ncbi:hypothetical protein SBA4_5370003 [Candidatus Sulfopaludibacter sp. SbA4]|nr:hypothetical protein SBA4_5370003 [Candidatus Sulfopaludibacter sp. SbA4]